MRSAERRARPASTLRQVLRKAARRLEDARVSFGHGTTNARDEAAWLVLHALGLPFEKLESRLDLPVTPGEIDRIIELIDERIRTRKPAAYLTREAWLGEHRFYVDERVIVPRSYIAELLRDSLAPWLAGPKGIRSALDLCTGSGCLAILVARAYRKARVDAADISADALAVAKRNVAQYRLGRRVKLVASDLYSNLRGRRYDLIVSNPPYVRDAVMRTLPAEYRREPALALAGGRDGLDLVRTILAEAPAHLNDGGLLVVEAGHNRERVTRAFPALPLVWAQTSGGDDCVFLVTREALTAARTPGRCRPAIRADASPPPRAMRSPVRASGAAAARRRRIARA
jgi:ribosomal protein L3 glutamine methyltransferase